ncbi:hypothetical protein L249_6026, partial [Ophiocordyceps polyrhachis-furcata BCC 54312]
MIDFELLVLFLREAIHPKGSKADFAIMHERLAHAGKEKVIQACRKAGIVIEKSTVEGFLCEACYFAKADTIISRDSLARPTRFLDIVFWDMIEHNPPGYGGARYSLHGIDAFTRFYWTMSAITKGQAYKLLRGWKRQVDASSGGIPIATMAFDNAAGRTLLTIARAICLYTKLPAMLWPHYMSMAAYVANLIPTGGKESPLERLMTALNLPYKYDISHLHAWGCTAYVTKPKEKIVRSEKMAPRAWKGHLVGIEGLHGHIFKIWLPDQEIVVRARDVRFVDRAGPSAIVDDPSIEFEARLEEEERDQGSLRGGSERPKGTLRTFPYQIPRLIKAKRHDALSRRNSPSADGTYAPSWPASTLSSASIESQRRKRRSSEEIWGTEPIRRSKRFARANLAAQKLCLYRHADGSLLVLYVDNILLAAPTKAQIDEKAAILDALYEVKHLGKPQEFLRLEFERDREAKTIRVHQTAFTKKILDMFDADDLKPTKTPWPSRHTIPHDWKEAEIAMERTMWQKRTGSLNWLALGSRPDITYSVKKLSEANCHLTHAHLVALKHLLRYLRGTHSLGITLGGAAYSTDLQLR